MRVFLTAIEAEFGTLSRSLGHTLGSAGHTVVCLDRDPAFAVALTERAEVIATTDLVVCVVGDRCGPFPGDRQVAALGDVAYQYNYRADTGQRETSFLHWDLLLACQRGLPAIIVMPDAACPRDRRNPERGDRQTDQRAFRRWLAELDLPVVKGATVEALAVGLLEQL